MNKCFIGDCRDTMRQWIAEGVKVNCVCTSPPYWGLRDYGIPPTVWGGNPSCNHQWWSVEHAGGGMQPSDKVRWQHVGAGPSGHAKSTSGFCVKCNAWMGNLGLEPDYRMFITNMVEVFSLVRELLTDDGVCFLNLGDSYSSGGRRSRDPGKSKIHEAFEGDNYIDGLRPADQPGIKPKDMLLIPARVAIALQDSGWYIRSAMPWLKRNGMPDSVTDRPAQSIEYVYMLTKSERYFWDGHAVKVRSSDGTNPRRSTKMPDGRDTGAGGHGAYHREGREQGKTHLPGNKTHRGAAAYEAGDEFHRTKAGLVNYATKQRKLAEAGSGTKTNQSFYDATLEHVSARNFRVSDPFFNSWQGMWTDDNGDPLAMIVNTRGYNGAHFATYPAELVRPLILAATSAHGHCPTCGAGWKRIVDKGEPDVDRQQACGGDTVGEYHGEAIKGYEGTGAQDPSAVKARILEGMRSTVTKGWQQTCKCGVSPQPAIVLDPFLGSGTTAQVAQELGRNWFGCDISTDYESLQQGRTRQQGLVLA